MPRPLYAREMQTPYGRSPISDGAYESLCRNLFHLTGAFSDLIRLKAFLELMKKIREGIMPGLLGPKGISRMLVMRNCRNASASIIPTGSSRISLRWSLSAATLWKHRNDF